MHFNGAPKDASPHQRATLQKAAMCYRTGTDIFEVTLNALAQALPRRQDVLQLLKIWVQAGAS